MVLLLNKREIKQNDGMYNSIKKHIVFKKCPYGKTIKPFNNIIYLVVDKA